MSGRRFGSLARLVSLAAPPAAPAAGDMWYRSDLSQYRASDGGAGEQLTLGPTGNIPVVATARWHHVGTPYGNAGTINLPNERLYAIPFWPGRACTLTGMAVNVTLALIGGSIRMGIYTSDGALPTTLHTDFGTVGAALTGIRSITGLTARVRPVLHYLVIARQSAGVTLTVSARSSWDPMVADAAATITANNNAYFIDGVSGALPASFGAPAGTDQGPCAVVQLT